VKIRDIRATTVTVPLEAPLRHANGCHWGRFVRTIVEVETDNGLIGLGEMGGGGETAEAVFRAMKAYLVGHDPARIEEMRFLIANPTASLYNNRTQVLAALEFACLDIGACPCATSWAAGCEIACRSRRTVSSGMRIRRRARAKFGRRSSSWNLPAT
jgi:L-alanine-DL-glutamate epimerase-like enolase superfamily enzyme